MRGAIESHFVVISCGCEESEQMRKVANLSMQRKNSLREQLQWLADFVGKDENGVEFAYLTSDADVQTEDFRHLQEGCTVCAAIEVIEAHCQQLKDELAAKEEELGSAAQKVSMVSERLEMELAAKQALQAKYNCVKADHQKFLLRQKVEELEDLALIRALCRELKDKQDAMETLQAKYDRVKADQQKLKETIAKQKGVGQMIVDVLKKQGPRTRGRFKLLLVGFLVTIVFFPLLVRHLRLARPSSSSWWSSQMRSIIDINTNTTTSKICSLVRASVYSLFLVFQKLF